MNSEKKSFLKFFITEEIYPLKQSEHLAEMPEQAAVQEEVSEQPEAAEAEPEAIHEGAQAGADNGSIPDKHVSETTDKKADTFLRVYVDDPYCPDGVSSKFKLILMNFLSAVDIREDKYEADHYSNCSGNFETKDAEDRKLFYLIFTDEDVSAVGNYPNVFVVANLEKTAMHRAEKRKLLTILNKITAHVF